MDELLKHKIALTLIPGVGGITAKKLISYCGGIDAVFEEKQTALRKIPGIGEHLAGTISRFNDYSRVEKEMLFIEKHKIKTLFFTEQNYPERLKHCEDGPILLFYKGAANLNKHKILAIVGTRNITEYGKAKCTEIVEGIKAHNPLIVSGLAYGVDARAHKESLDNGLQTVGVLGHGLDRIYPHLNKNLATRMLNEGGGLLTDFVSETKPDRENFPKRNRIIAGLADALVVVEAARTGGALITAHIANSYNRDVFAVPGKTKDLFSQGCNLLIKSHKANLLETAADIEYIMRWESNPEKDKQAQQSLFVDLEPDEQMITDLIREEHQASFDFIINKSGLSFSRAASLLLNLEFKGIIKPLPGRIFKLSSKF